MTAQRTPDPEAPEQIPWYDQLRKLLEPYEPADSASEADELFTTLQIKQALESHLGIPQGDPKAESINGLQLVEQLQHLGFRFENTGTLEFNWLMKKKIT